MDALSTEQLAQEVDANQQFGHAVLAVLSAQVELTSAAQKELHRHQHRGGQGQRVPKRRKAADSSDLESDSNDDRPKKAQRRSDTPLRRWNASTPAPAHQGSLAADDDQISEWTRLFFQAGPVNGLLSESTARPLFLKSKLPVNTLQKIWCLADTQDRGALDLADFILGMRVMSNVLRHRPIVVPTAVSASLLDPHFWPGDST